MKVNPFLSQPFTFPPTLPTYSHPIDCFALLSSRFLEINLFNIIKYISLGFVHLIVLHRKLSI